MMIARSAALAALLAWSGCDAPPACETGTSGCACYGNGSCNDGLSCTSGTCMAGDGSVPPLTGATLELYPSDRASLGAAGDLQVRAAVRDLAGNLLMNTTSRPIVVAWTIADESVATVEPDGVIRAIGSGSTTLEARIEGTTTTVSLPLVVGASALSGIVLDPAAAAIDVTGMRTFDVSAVDASGAPTGLTCTPELGFDPSIVGATATVTPGDESVEVTGLAQGTTLIELRCGAIDATPAIVEVKPAVRIPNPAPSADADFGYAPSFALDSPLIHVASFDASNTKLVYTVFDRTWQTETLDGEGVYGRSSAVVLDPLSARRPIVCADENGGLTCWALAADGFWTRERIAGASASMPEALRAAVGPSGVVYVAYRSSTRRTLEVAISRGAARDDWTVARLLTGFDGDFDMALGPDGLPRFVVQRGGLFYASVDGALTLTAEAVDTDVADAAVGASARLAIGADNRPQIVYLKNGNLIHAVRTAGAWRAGVVESVEAEPGSLTLAIDRHGEPRAAYVDARDDMLRYAYRLRSRRAGSPNRWRIESPEASEVGTADTELLVDAEDRAHLVYYRSRARSVDYYVEPYGLDYSDPLALVPEDASNTVVTERGAPGPTGTTARPTARDAVEVRWTPIAGATGYRVHWRNGASPSRADEVVESVAPPVVVPDLPAGRIHFAVSAIVADEETALSASATTLVLLERIGAALGPRSESPFVVPPPAIAFDGREVFAGRPARAPITEIARMDVATGGTVWSTFSPERAISAIARTSTHFYAFGSAGDLVYDGDRWWSVTASGAATGTVRHVAAVGETLHVWRTDADPRPYTHAACAASGAPRLLTCTAVAVPGSMPVLAITGGTPGVIGDWVYFAAAWEDATGVILTRYHLVEDRYETFRRDGLRSIGYVFTHGDRVYLVAHDLSGTTAVPALAVYDPSTSAWTVETQVAGFMQDARCGVASSGVYCVGWADDDVEYFVHRVATEALGP